MEWHHLYLLLKLDAIQNMFVGISVLIFLSLIANCVLWGLNAEDVPRERQLQRSKTHKKALIWSSCLFFLFVLAATLIPTTKEAAIIYVTPKIINSIQTNEELKKIPKGLVDLANDWIEELKPEKKEVQK